MVSRTQPAVPRHETDAMYSAGQIYLIVILYLTISNINTLLRKSLTQSATVSHPGAKLIHLIGFLENVKKEGPNWESNPGPRAIKREPKLQEN